MAKRELEFEDEDEVGGEYEVGAEVEDVLEEYEYVFDDAESDATCAGYSRFAELGPDAISVYSFALIDKKGIQVYATHPRFAEVTKGDYLGTEADGQVHLTVTVEDADDSVALEEALDTLWAAVESALGV